MYPSRQITIAATSGEIRVRSFCTPGQIRSFTLDRTFDTYAQYKSIFTRRETLEKHAAAEGTNVVVAVTPDQRIVAFGVLSHPEPDERWTQLGRGMMMELKVIEVSRDFRSLGLARRIMALLVDHPRIEAMIAYLVGYSWTWDLDGNGMTAQQYRNLLIGLFAPYGFVEMQTNDPNICLKPENLFMARVGRDVPAAVQKAFKWLRFGIEESL